MFFFLTLDFRIIHVLSFAQVNHAYIFQLFLQFNLVPLLVPQISVTFMKAKHMQTHAVCAPVTVRDISGGSWWPHTHTVLSMALSLLSVALLYVPQGSRAVWMASIFRRSFCVWCVRALCNLLSAVSLSRHPFIRLWWAECQATAGPPDWLNITAKLLYKWTFSEEIVGGCQAVARVLLVSCQGVARGFLGGC